MKTFDSPNNSPVNCLVGANGSLVFGGCADGGVIAWNILEDKSDLMQPEGATVSPFLSLFHRILSR
jgi:hypothetical protein